MALCPYGIVGVVPIKAVLASSPIGDTPGSCQHPRQKIDVVVPALLGKANIFKQMSMKHLCRERDVVALSFQQHKQRILCPHDPFFVKVCPSRAAYGNIRAIPDGKLVQEFQIIRLKIWKVQNLAKDFQNI